MDAVTRLLGFAQKHKHVKKSLDIVEEALTRFRPDQVCVSFNGGKDCTAVLHLVHSVIKNYWNHNNNETKLTIFYARLPNCFEEEIKFVDETIKRYNLNLMQYSRDKSLKESLFSFKTNSPETEAIFIGTRRDDFKPGTPMAAFAPTDCDWPKFIRVNPILDWSYAQVWEFIRHLDLPYCDLYNQGYSSLGTKSNTKKNSSLLQYNESGEAYYLPAWHLSSANEERLSRSSSMDVQPQSDQTSVQH